MSEQKDRDQFIKICKIRQDQQIWGAGWEYDILHILSDPSYPCFVLKDGMQKAEQKRQKAE